MPGDAASNVVPIQASLHLENARGFGDWRVYISSRANRDLRDARNRNPEIFRVIVKKIKELSNGHFSYDNQKRLNHSNMEIPIFEAKMTRDSRLVYQVDVVPEDGREIQTLKIYGIYTHAQLDKRLWSSLGSQLAHRGKDYLDRVNYRTRPVVTGDNVYYPGSFPPVENEAASDEDESSLPPLPKEDMEEVHTLLVLEKYVPLTRDVISCLIANLDVSFVPMLSPEEQEIIKHAQSCYVLGRSGTGKTATMMWKMFGIEISYQELFSETVSRPRQVFVTQSRSLAVRVEESYSKLTKARTTLGKGLKALHKIAQEQTDKMQEQAGLVDLDEEEEYRSLLPTKFSELKDEHFPLFVTFDKLCKLLEADARAREDPGTRNAPTGSLVTYDFFLGEYWPHFSQNLTKGLDPSLVFSEIMGVIKGSEKACRAQDRYLSRSAYEKLSTRTQATFATQRGRVYEIFEQYMKQKRLRGDYDAADRTHKLLVALNGGLLPFLGRRFDYLYVDEVQDNLMIDAYLMRYLCRNPAGLFWAGDTAQTISVGSSFRFNELKSFLFRVEQENFSEVAQAGEIMPPSTFELTVNYRSHAGILDCAHTVIELIVEFWPYSIDMLQRGRGVVRGIKPVFFRGWDQTNVRYEQFLFKATSGNYIEFGAKQCILVRNDAAREKLREHVGDIGLIMTLYESKGLEFDDVLLFDFFEDSTVDLSQWRVVLNLIPEKDRNFVSTPRFDDTQHAGVNTELKFLYVAITRARKNMWIVDRSGRGEPMRLLWSGRNQIEDCTPETGVPQLAVSSTPEEWVQTARVLFDRKQYFHAMKCFERAEQPRSARIAEAYHLRVQARQMPKTTKKEEVAARQGAFRRVAEAFLQCAGEQETNAKDRLTYYRVAAESLDEAGDYRKAAETYILAEDYGTAATLYRQHGFFDQAVRVVKQYRARVPEETAESIVFVARLYYFKENKLQAASELFDSVEEELEFCEDYDLDVAKASLLEAKGDIAGAVQLHLDEGRISDAISLLLKDKESESSQSKAAECILDGFWGMGLFAVSPRRIAQDPNTKKLLSLSERVNVGKLTVMQRNELAMFKAILGKEMSNLRDLGLSFYKANRKHAALLCLDHFFAHFPAIKVSSAGEIAPILEAFAIYTQVLGDLASRPDACNLASVQRLFNLTMTTQNVFLVPSETFLHGQIMKGRTRIQSTSEDGVTVNNADLATCLQQYIKFRLRDQIVLENTSCQHAKAFMAPCISYTVLGKCNRPDCHRLHIERKDMTVEWYNAQIRIYLQQFLIINFFPTFPGELRNNLISLRRHWMDRFYETLFPPHYTLGTIASLRSSSVPEARRGMQIVKYWCQDVLNQSAVPQNERDRQMYLTLLTRAATIMLTFDDGENTSYLYSSPGIKACNTFKDFVRIQQPNFCRDISQDFLCALQIKFRSSMRCGYYFIQHVINKKIEFDVSMLCDLVESTCAALIVAKAPNPFQHVTMPRSWFLNLFPKLDPTKPMEMITPLEMVNLIGHLLKVIHFDVADYLLFENTNLSKVPAMRNVFVARLCRAIALLGFNEKCAGDHRPKILGHLNKLNSNEPTFRPHASWMKYAEARQWGEIARLIHSPDTSSPMDMMVTLCHHGVPKDKIGYRLVVCKNHTEIPKVLGQNAPFTSKLSAAAKEFVPAAAQKAKEAAPAPVADHDDSDDDMPPLQDVSDSSEDEDNGFRDTVKPSAEAAGAEQETAVAGEDEEVAFAFQEPTEEQISAANLIQRTYRQFRRRRQPSSSTNARVAEFFKTALEASSAIPWKTTSRRYRLLYLGAVPHALVCLDIIDGWAKVQKAKNKKKFAKGGHEDIETNGKALTGIVQFLKTTRGLKAVLEPKSKLHMGRDIVELKNRVRELETLCNNLQASHPGALDEVLDDLATVVRSVVGPVKPLPTHCQSKPKPELNVEDL